jgi:hypothetical protein
MRLLIMQRISATEHLVPKSGPVFIFDSDILLLEIQQIAA